MLNVQRSMFNIQCKMGPTVQDSAGNYINFELKNSVGNHKEFSLKGLLVKDLVTV